MLARARTVTKPHVQVNVEQKFVMEWATGHGGPTFFVFLRAEDEAMLKTISRALLWKYLANAPPEAHTYFNGIPNNPKNPNATADPVWLKIHLRRYKVADNHWHIKKPNAFRLPENHRSMLMFGDRRPWGRDRWDYLGYWPERRGQDQRVAYHNPEIPWIMAVHVFAIPWTFARSGDGAHFAFPPGTTPGRHIAYYMWAGYRDCVDIDVLPDDKQVTRTPRGTYGFRPPGETPLRKIDHCQYVDGMYDLLVQEGATCTNGTILSPTGPGKSLQPDTRGGSCFAIPPVGKRNSQNLTTDEALAACRVRCTLPVPGYRKMMVWSFNEKRYYTRGAWCSGMNVVPLDPYVHVGSPQPYVL